MQIKFKTKKLAKIFNIHKTLVLTHGARQARKIEVRMAALRAAQSLADLAPPYSPPERCHEVSQGHKKCRLSVDLEHPYRLIFTPDHEPLPVRKEGGLDWAGVTAIIILGVEDTHD